MKNRRYRTATGQPLDIEQQMVADLLTELEAAHLIIDQFERLRRDHHLSRPFTLRLHPRQDLIAFAKDELAADPRHQ